MKAPTTILLLIMSSIHVEAQQVLVPMHFHPRQEAETHTVIDDDERVLIAESLKSRDDVLVFDLEIQNRSLRELELDPSKMVIMTSDRPFPTASSAGIETVQEFEQSLTRQASLSKNDVTDTYHRKMRARKGLGIALTALATGLAVYDLVKDAGDWSKEFWTATDIRRSNARDVGVITAFFISDGARHLIADANSKTDEELHYLDQEILAATLLDPMEAVRGKVFFSETRSKYYRLIIPLDGTEYAFDFRKPGKRDRKALKRAGK